MPFANSAVAAALAIAAAGPPAAETGLRFDDAFPVTHAPRASRASVLYRGRDGVHRLVLTRDVERRVRRDTDARLTSIAIHRPGDPGYRLDVFDHARRIHTVVDRDSLYRVGRFTDWTDLAHGLRRPAAGFAVRAAGHVRSPVALVGACRWFELTQSGHRSAICWSAAEALPLAVLDEAGRIVWRVTAVDHRPVDTATFSVRARDYILEDAAAEISRD